MPYPPLRHRRGRKWVIKAIRLSLLPHLVLVYICWHHHYAHSINARSKNYTKSNFQHLLSNTEKTGGSPIRGSRLYYSTPESYAPCHPKSNFHQWNLWGGYHCRHFCEQSGWVTGLTCWKERGPTRRWCLVGGFNIWEYFWWLST